MTTLKIELIDRQFADHLAQIAARLGNLRPVFDDIGAVIESRTEIRFALKQDPTGQPWKPWAASTERRRVKEGRGTLLEYTRRMLDSLNHVATPDAALVGFGVPYAASHELGASINIPARSQRATFKVDKNTGQSRFARRSKANFEQWVTLPAYTITLRARRMLTADGRDLGDGDKRAVLATLADYLTPP